MDGEGGNWVEGGNSGEGFWREITKRDGATSLDQ